MYLTEVFMKTFDRLTIDFYKRFCFLPFIFDFKIESGPILKIRG